MTDVDALPLPGAALWYASRGIPVFPCRPRAKEPLTDHGFHDASADFEQVRAWWRRWPQANIGIPTGEPSGWLVVDIDPRHGGDRTIEELIERHGRWPDTAEALTGGGGRHVIFRHESGLKCGEIAEGIDLKTTGGYIIASPSVHPSGGRYCWDGLDGAEALARLVHAPGWLLRIAREKAQRKPVSPS